MKETIEKFTANYDLSDDVVQELLEHAAPVHFHKGERVVGYGEYNDTFYLLCSGICRAFIPQSGNEDRSLWFVFGGEVIFDVFCYHGRTTSKIAIEAETDCEAWSLPKEELEALCASSIGMANSVRHIFEHHAFVFEENVLSLFCCDNAMERYLSLLKRHPELLQQVPLKKLASYLLVTPQSLSRIRANLKE